MYKNIDLYKSCKGFLIDMHWNGGGDSRAGDAFAQLFFDGPFTGAPTDSAQYIANYGAYAKFMDLEKLDLSDPFNKLTYDVGKRELFYSEAGETYIPDCPAYLTQPVVILYGRHTASAAEDFLCLMKKDNRATLVGMPSYGSNGQPFMGDYPAAGSFVYAQ